MIRLRRGGRIALGVILTTILIDFMGYLLLLPVLPEHLKGLGARETSDQGLIIGLYMFALVVALPIWGWMADRVGRRPVLLTCLLGTSFSFALMAASQDLGLFYLARVLQGVFGASVGTAQAYISDLTREEDRARGFGLIGAAGSLGLLGGPALGGALYRVDPILPFQAPAVLAVVAAFGAALFLPESRGPSFGKAPAKDLLRSIVPAPLWILFGVHQPRILLYLYLFFHLFVAFGAVEAMFPNYFDVVFEWDPGQVGLFLTYVGLITAITQGLLIGRLIRVFGELPLVLGGLAIATGAMFALTQLSSLGLLALAGLALAVGFGAVVPTFTSMFSKACGDDETGAFHAHSQAMLNLGRGVGAFLGGVVAGHLGAAAPFLLGSLALLGALGILGVASPWLRVRVGPPKDPSSRSGHSSGERETAARAP